MKNTILLTTLSILIGMSVMAQENNAKGIKLGFQFTPKVSWLTSDHESIDGAGSVFGYSFGLRSDYFFTENYAFTSGILLSRMGGNLKYNDNSMSYNVGTKTISSLPLDTVMTFGISYLEIPLSLKLSTGGSGRANFFGQFGLSPMIKTQAVNDVGTTISSEVNPFNLNYHIGGGIEYFINKSTSAIFSITYNNGFVDVTQNIGGKDDKSQLKSIDFNFGIIF